MLETGLYVEEIAKAYCHPRRYQHCVTMSALAVELAKAHGVNPRKAYVAGMLHDLAKGLDEETARGWIEVYWPQARDQAWKIWHQYIGASLAENPAVSLRSGNSGSRGVAHDR